MGNSVCEYLASPYDKWDEVLRDARCTNCHCAFQRHSTRSRAAWDDNEKKRISVLRVQCPCCDKTHTVLPDFLTPLRRYITPVREAVVMGANPAPPCDERTARRWIHAFKTAIITAIHHITSWVIETISVLNQQESRFLTGEIRGVSGLQHLSKLVEKHVRGSPASCLLGWVNRDFGILHEFVL